MKKIEEQDFTVEDNGNYFAFLELLGRDSLYSTLRFCHDFEDYREQCDDNYYLRNHTWLSWYRYILVSRWPCETIDANILQATKIHPDAFNFGVVHMSKTPGKGALLLGMRSKGGNNAQHLQPVEWS